MAVETFFCCKSWWFFSSWAMCFSLLLPIRSPSCSSCFSPKDLCFSMRCWSYVDDQLVICWSYVDMCCWSYFSGSCFGIFLLFTVWPPGIKQLLGCTCCDQGPRPKYLLPREKGSTMKWFNININYQWVQGGTDYDYPEYPIYERSDQVDYNGGLFEDYPSSVLQGSLQKGTQRAGLEDYQGYQKLGLGYQDQTTRRFLRRLGNLASKKEIEDEADVWILQIRIVGSIFKFICTLP